MSDSKAYQTVANDTVFLAMLEISAEVRFRQNHDLWKLVLCYVYKY